MRSFRKFRVNFYRRAPQRVGQWGGGDSWELQQDSTRKTTISAPTITRGVFYFEEEVVHLLFHVTGLWIVAELPLLMGNGSRKHRGRRITAVVLPSLPTAMEEMANVGFYRGFCFDFSLFIACLRVITMTAPPTASV